MKGAKKPNVSFKTNLLTSKEMIGSRGKFPSPFLLLLEGAQQPVVSKHHLQTSCTCSYAHETERECRDREISRDKETQRQKRKKDKREREEERGRLTL